MMLGVTIWKIEKRDKIVGWLFGGGYMAHGTWNMALWIASLVPSPRREMPSRNAHATLYHATLLDPEEERE
jgi:hypothetical protein